MAAAHGVSGPTGLEMACWVALYDAEMLDCPGNESELYWHERWDMGDNILRTPVRLPSLGLGEQSTCDGSCAPMCAWCNNQADIAAAERYW